MKAFAPGFTLLVALFAGHGVSAESSADAALDAFHAAGASGDSEGLRLLLTDDAVLLGADGDGRLAGQALQTFIRTGLPRDKAWDYRSTRRETRLSPAGSIAWFDETLVDSKLVPFRGSGVLVRGKSGWKVAQYHLSLSIPDEKLPAVADLIGQERDTSQGLLSSNPDNPSAPATRTAEPEKNKPCGKMRHKTNKRASC